jgi:hypothetical protein
MRSSVALAALPLLTLLLAGLAGACSNQGEGERCDQLADNNGDSDCNDGLTCQNIGNYGFICCPADRTQATTTQCALNNPGINADSSPPGDDGSAADSSGEGGGDAAGDAADVAVDAIDAPSEGAADASGN